MICSSRNLTYKLEMSGINLTFFVEIHVICYNSKVMKP